MKFLETVRKKYYFLVLLVVFSLVLVHIGQASAASSSTQDITVASQDYVDAKISELNAKIDQLTQQLQSQSKFDTYDVISLDIGQTLIAGASSEIIVRSGVATAISGKNGDPLADMTTDDSKKTNIYTGQTVPINHLLLVSRDDGRGIKAVGGDKVYILFKGTYTIK